jgi:gliding motility-associated lipoprotein GldH
MPKMLKVIFFTVLTSVLLTACSSNALHTESIAISGRAWKQGVKTEFKVPIKDTARLYDVVLTVRTTSDYPYSNLWMYLTVDGPLGKSKRFPLEIRTADATGKWMGDKSGSTVVFSKVITHDRFPKKGTYRFSFEQASTDKVLPEVMDLTLELFSKDK